MLGWHQATFNLSLRPPLGEVFQALVTCFLRLQCPMLSVLVTKDKPNLAFDLIGCRPAECDLF